MPAVTDADTIRILVATDNHVGYNERDPIRGDDSWKSFHEVMCLAKDNDVDMVLLAGDLYHENKPSRKSMYQVMRSLRMNCYGDKPCELEMLSDATENFQGAFNHVNYEDPDINVAIPVFSIHGNHDDPSGEGHLAALDLLQISGLVNYYGRTPESDNIMVKPVLLQKGRTKLALYGMSNVRDERLYRTFHDGKVKFFQPSTQKENWFNLMSVHQNHHAYTEKGYLPENFLPDFLDLVVWGHEHECLINPRYNPEMSFHVMQPGSSVATSLMPGEAVAKHVAILSITGKEFKCETIRLKTVRPFVMKEISLQDEPGMKTLARKDNNRTEITRHLISIVEGLIEEAKAAWLTTQDEEEVEDDVEAPLPLIRLRVEYTAPEGGNYDCENPQRFSNRFVGKVANVNDVIQFHRKKTGTTRKLRDGPDLPEESVMAQLSMDNVKVDKLVREFLTAQSLTILPQNSFGDAVSQYVDKDDKHAMETFVNESLTNQVAHLLEVDEVDGEDISNAMEQYRSKLEELFAAGHLKRAKKGKFKQKPAQWDSDLDGEWADQPGALILSDKENENSADNEENNPESSTRTPAATRGRGRRGPTTGITRNGTISKQAAAKSKTTTANGRADPKDRAGENEHDEDEDDDAVMLDDDDEDIQGKPPKRSVAHAPRKRAASPVKKAPAKARATPRSSARQSKLSFSQTQPIHQARQTKGKKPTVQELSDDEVSDDDDAFGPAPVPVETRSRRR